MFYERDIKDSNSALTAGCIRILATHLQTQDFRLLAWSQQLITNIHPGMFMSMLQLILMLMVLLPAAADKQPDASYCRSRTVAHHAL